MSEPGVSLEQLLDQVEKALAGDQLLQRQLFRTMLKLARHPQAEPEDRELGRILARVLMGDRSPDLSALPADMAAEIAERLNWPSG